MIIKLFQNGDPWENYRILQQALDQGGTIRIEEPGVYPVAGRLVIGSFTTLEFGSGVFLKRSETEENPVPQLLINKGVLNGETNQNIVIDGLYLITNNAKCCHKNNPVHGLRGHLGFINVNNLVIRNFDCHDLSAYGYAIQICHFENILIENAFIEGDKDGIHLGQGKGFTIRHCRFRTFDDPIALNAWDYCMSNARFGWLEDGLIEDCYDLDADTTGYFARLIGGSWCNWHEGMIVQNSTCAVYDGILYSANMLPVVEREIPLRSFTPPTHKEGLHEYDGISWRAVQKHDGSYDAGCRNITFRDIHLQKARQIAICFELSTGPWAVSVPENLEAPFYSNITFDNIHCSGKVRHFLVPSASCHGLKIVNSKLDCKETLYYDVPCDLQNRLPASDVIIANCVFNHPDAVLINAAETRKVTAKVSGCIWQGDQLPPCKGDVTLWQS